MTTSSLTHPRSLRGDICPAWCGGNHVNYRDDRGRPAHADDCGVWHHGPNVDSWSLDGGDTKIEVTIEGYRHDNTNDDWPDNIKATNVDPGNLGEVCLPVTAARRLAKALLLACDLADGIALPEVLR